MQEQSTIQRCYCEQCVLLNNAYEKCKIYFHWLFDNKSGMHIGALFQRKHNESNVITQTLPMHRLENASKQACFEVEILLFNTS